MSVEFTCPACRTVLRVSQEALGSQARCPVCGTCESVPETADLLTPTESTSWLRAPDGQVYGPCSFLEIQRWGLEGRIDEEFQVRPVGEDSWHPLRIQVLNNSASPVGVAQPTERRPHRAGRMLMLGGAGLCFPPLSIAALFAARSDLEAMHRGQMDRRGRSATLTGMGMGVLSVGLQLYSLGQYFQLWF